MFDRMLIPVPPDSLDESVAAYGVELAETFDADAIVLTVLDRPQQRDQIRADQETEARERIGPLVERLELRGRHAESEIIPGAAEEEILRVIKDRDVDLVVMGTHARTGVDRMILGSVAESVIRDAPVPVLTVTPGATPPAEIAESV